MNISGTRIDTLLAAVIAPSLERGSLLLQFVETDHRIGRTVSVDPVRIGCQQGASARRVDPRKIILEIDRSRALGKPDLKRPRTLRRTVGLRNLLLAGVVVHVVGHDPHVEIRMSRNALALEPADMYMRFPALARCHRAAVGTHDIIGIVGCIGHRRPAQVKAVSRGFRRGDTPRRLQLREFRSRRIGVVEFHHPEIIEEETTLRRRSRFEAEACRSGNVAHDEAVAHPVVPTAHAELHTLRSILESSVTLDRNGGRIIVVIVVGPEEGRTADNHLGVDLRPRIDGRNPGREDRPHGRRGSQLDASGIQIGGGVARSHLPALLFEQRLSGC